MNTEGKIASSFTNFSETEHCILNLMCTQTHGRTHKGVHMYTHTPTWFLLSSCPPYCSRLHIRSFHPVFWGNSCVYDPLTYVVNSLKKKEGKKKNHPHNGQVAVWSCVCCVFMFSSISVCACVFSGLEQAALGVAFCCSWGATVLSPNRSLVPAVVPREGF